MKRIMISLIIVVALAAIVVLVLSIYHIGSAEAEYQQGEEIYAQAESAFITPVTTEQMLVSESSELDLPEPSESEFQAEAQLSEITPPFVVDFSAIQAVNPDVVAWIYCEGTQVSYPVLRGKTNSDYLKRTYDGTYNSAGSIFMDYRNDPGFQDRNTVLYGHNMLNGSMFHCLNDFVSQEYFDEHSTWYIITPNKTYKLQIFASLITSYADELKLFQAISYDSENWFDKYDDIMLDAEAKNEDVIVAEQDCLVMLSTCNYSFENARCVVIGKLISSE